METKFDIKLTLSEEESDRFKRYLDGPVSEDMPMRYHEKGSKEFLYQFASGGRILRKDGEDETNICAKGLTMKELEMIVTAIKK